MAAARRHDRRRRAGTVVPQRTRDERVARRPRRDPPPRLRCSDDHVYAVLRRGTGGTSGTSMLLVNLSDQHRSIMVDLAPDALDGPPRSRDVLGDTTLSWSSIDGRFSTAVELEPYQAVAVPLDGPLDGITPAH